MPRGQKSVEDRPWHLKTDIERDELPFLRHLYGLFGLFVMSVIIEGGPNGRGIGFVDTIEHNNSAVVFLDFGCTETWRSTKYGPDRTDHPVHESLAKIKRFRNNARAFDAFLPSLF